MSVLSNFESKVEGAVDGAAAAMFSSPIEPAQIAKKAEKQMKREKLVGSGRQYAPTLYNVLVSELDDKRLFGFYPTMASEIENYLYARGTEAGMEFDTRPLVRFIPDPGLKKGRFDVIAEVVAAPIIKKLRVEELEYYGLAPKGSAEEAQRESGKRKAAAQANPGAAYSAVAPSGQEQPFAGYPPHPQSGKYAGSDALKKNDNLEDFSAITPPAKDKDVAQAQGARAASVPAVEKKAARQALQSDIYEPEETGVIGRAMIYNSSEQIPYHLDKRKLTVGRGKDNDIVISDANASRVHARFSQDATGKWKVTDLDSTNGTLLNGKPIISAILKSGDEVIIGTTVLGFTD